MAQDNCNNKTENRSFFGKNVRIVNDEWIVLRDVVDVLGKIKEDGTWTNSKIKVFEFMDLLGKSQHHQELGVLTRKQSRKEYQQMICIKIEDLPIVLTQLKPIQSNKISTGEFQRRIDCWKDFMLFVDKLLQEHKVHEYLVKDYNVVYKEELDRFKDLGAKGFDYTVAQNSVNKILGYIVTKDINFYLKTEDLKIYQDQTTIDLMRARAFILESFVSQYCLTNSKSVSKKNTLLIACKKYHIDIPTNDELNKF